MCNILKPRDQKSVFLSFFFSIFFFFDNTWDTSYGYFHLCIWTTNWRQDSILKLLYSPNAFVQSFWLGWVVRSWPLFWALFVSFILGTAYSIDVSGLLYLIIYFPLVICQRANPARLSDWLQYLHAEILIWHIILWVQKEKLNLEKRWNNLYLTNLLSRWLKYLCHIWLKFYACIYSFY